MRRVLAQLDPHAKHPAMPAMLCAAAPAARLRARPGWLLACLGLTVGLTGCSEELLEPGRIEFIGAGDSEPWREPGFEIQVTKTDEAGSTQDFARFDSPATGFSLGRGAVGRVHVRGRNAQGDVEFSADSVFIDPLGVAERTLPLPVGRAGSLSLTDRLAEQLAQPLVLSAVVAERYLLSASADARGQLYDLGLWRRSDPFDLPCPSETDCRIQTLLVFDGWIGVFIGPGGASFLDFGSGDQGTLDPPEAGLFQAVAGGQVISAPSGDHYVIGATRLEAATDRVLHIHTDGELSALRLASPRQGAAAAYLDGRGLLVVGGSDTAAGIEQLKPQATAFDTLSAAPDPTRGAAIFEAADGVFRVGGGGDGTAAPSAKLDLGCASACEPAIVGDPLGSADPVSLGTTAGGEVLLLANGPSGESQLFGVSTSQSALQLTPIGSDLEGSASLLQPLPTGQLAVLGGANSSGPLLSLQIYFQR